jgi:hypothetical protein
MSEAAVYVAPDVAAVRALWDGSGALAGPAIGPQLAAFAEALAAAHSAGEHAAAVLMKNWSARGRDELEPTGSLSQQYARLIVARDHGFTSWSAVEG